MLTKGQLKRNNIILFICIAIIIFVYPFMPKVSDFPLFKILTISLIILSSISALDFGRKTHLALKVAGFITLLVFWSASLTKNQYYEIFSLLMIIFFMSYSLIIMVWHISRSRDIGTVIILNAVNSYLLIGIIGAMMFAVSEIFFPGGLKMGGLPIDTFRSYLYFSFVTMTTLGYGDISPVSSFTQVLAVFLSLAGQLYLAIIMAMLIGKFLSRES
jgi:hypothetical protein